MRPCTCNDNHHPQKILREQMVPDLDLVPLRQFIRRAVLRFRLPVEEPGIIEIFSRNFSLQPVEHSVLSDEVLLKVFLSEVIHSQIQLSIELFQIAVSTVRGQSRMSGVIRVSSSLRRQLRILFRGPTRDSSDATAMPAVGR